MLMAGEKVADGEAEGEADCEIEAATEVPAL
jgi:hypothetical protein